MTIDFVYNFISKNKYAVISTITKNNLPEAALVGIAVTKDLKIIFDTSNKSRKYKNLENSNSIAIVIGWNNEQTLQYEGNANIISGKELNDLLETYFRVFPDGKERRERDKDITYFCVQPKWLRYSDYNTMQVEELSF